MGSIPYFMEKNNVFFRGGAVIQGLSPLLVVLLAFTIVSTPIVRGIVLRISNACLRYSGRITLCRPAHFILRKITSKRCRRPAW
jgi:hypothetical protein